MIHCLAHFLTVETKYSTPTGQIKEGNVSFESYFIDNSDQSQIFPSQGSMAEGHGR